MAATVATGIACGLAPAFRAAAVSPDPVLREGGRGTTDRTGHRLASALVVAQIAAVVTVVGVVASMRRSPMHDTALASAYLPFAQYPNGAVTFVTRARGSLAPAVRALAAAVHDADPELLAEDVRPLYEDAAQFMAPLRLVMTVLSGFALTAVLLAALGIFGVMSHAVVRRHHEMAVRSALGASRPAIVRLVLGGALRLTALGLAIGTLLSTLAARALRAYLFGVTATDPPTYLAVAVAVPLIVLAACWRPARMAAGADPMTLLRQ